MYVCLRIKSYFTHTDVYVCRERTYTILFIRYMVWKMHLILSHTCVWQDSCTHVTMNHVHVSDDPDTHIKYYNIINSSLHIHFYCFIMLNPYPCIFMHHIVHMPKCFYKKNEIVQIQIFMWIHPYTCRSRKRRNLWHVTFIHMYFCDAYIHTCDMMVHIYIHFQDVMQALAHSCVQ